MSKHYFNPDISGYVLKALKHHLGEIEKKPDNSYWHYWYHKSEIIGGYCSSPYPGPNYGNTAWIREDLVEIVNSTIVPIRHSRGLTGTEAHFINKRLSDRARGWKNDFVLLIKEVEELYKLLIEQGITRVDKGSCQISWYTHERIRL